MGSNPTGHCSSPEVSDPEGYPDREHQSDATEHQEFHTPAEENNHKWHALNEPQEANLLQIGLVDGFAFTRGCLIEALTTSGYGFTVKAFESVETLLAFGIRNFDVILCYDHEQIPSAVLGETGDDGTRDEFAGVPVIILSDALMALTSRTVRAALKCGVRGFVSTRTFEIKTVSAAIRFVTAGGIFAPVDLLLEDEAKPAPAADDATLPAGLLTPRQRTVLLLLQQGKANKIIAYELGMSESTVKVHIRNIMRKMGASNRTQALYKLQQLSNGRALADCVGA